MIRKIGVIRKRAPSDDNVWWSRDDGKGRRVEITELVGCLARESRRRAKNCHRYVRKERRRTYPRLPQRRALGRFSIVVHPELLERFPSACRILLAWPLPIQALMTTRCLRRSTRYFHTCLFLTISLTSSS